MQVLGWHRDAHTDSWQVSNRPGGARAPGSPSLGRGLVRRPAGLTVLFAKEGTRPQGHVSVGVWWGCGAHLGISQQAIWMVFERAIHSRVCILKCTLLTPSRICFSE